MFRRKDGIWLRKRVVAGRAGEWRTAAEDDMPLAAASAAAARLRDQQTSCAGATARCAAAGCVLPVQGASEVLALIVIDTRERVGPRAAIALLSACCAIYRSHLAALDYGDVDELTRLANRRTFDEQFGRFALAGRAPQAAPAADRRSPGARAHLGVADIDFFKQVNDRFGHPYGDEVLVLFAGLMRETFRETDKLFRFGGEEFVILMSNCGARRSAGGVRALSRRGAQRFAFPQVGQVTVSIGVTSLRPNETGTAAFGRADRRSTSPSAAAATACCSTSCCLSPRRWRPVRKR